MFPLLRFISLTFALHLPIAGNTQDLTAGELIKFSLEQLMDMHIEVTSTTKYSEIFFESPSAISVITSEDIQRSGVTNIADALRIAPGIQVSKVSSHEWAVGIRGLNGRFSRYLLVLIDGRSVYDPLFSGVNWDELNIPLSNIKQIEVIRGPGGTLWGTNAVNGVINIITKDANSEQGWSLIAATGDMNKTQVNINRNYSLHKNNHLRVGASYHQRDGFDAQARELTEGDNHNERLDLKWLYTNNKNTLKIDASINNSEAEPILFRSDPTSLTLTNAQGYLFSPDNKKGYSTQLRWEHEYTNNIRLQTRFSHEAIEREVAIAQWDTTNTDLDIEIKVKTERHQLTAGLNSRFSISDLESLNSSILDLSPSKQSINIWSGFFHHSFFLNPYWKLVYGLRYEYNSDTNENLRGTLKTIVQLNEQQRLWFSVSKSESSPSRITTDRGSYNFATISAIPSLGIPPILLRAQSSNKPLKNTTSVATEIGYRYSFDKTLNMDIAYFHYDLKNLQSGILSSQLIKIAPVSNLPYIELTIELADQDKFIAQGIEYTAKWNFTPNWHLLFSSSYLNYVRKSAPLNNAGIRSKNSALPTDVPTTTHSLRLLADLSDKVSVNFWLRYVDELKDVGIDEYTVIDIMTRYRFSKDLSVDAVIQNLGEGSHAEVEREAYSAGIFEVPTSFYFRLNWSF